MATEYDLPSNRAFEAFKRADFTYGATLTKEWIEQAFDYPPLANDSFDESNKHQQLKRREMSAFKGLLREKPYQMMLLSLWDGGYTICPSEEEANVVTSHASRAISNVLDKSEDQLSHTNLSRLSAAGRQEHGAAVAKLSQMKGLTRKTLTHKH